MSNAQTDSYLPNAFAPEVYATNLVGVYTDNDLAHMTFTTTRSTYGVGESTPTLHHVEVARLVMTIAQTQNMVAFLTARLEALQR